MYYDPNAYDPLEAAKATLPLDVQRRMVAVDVAARAMLWLRDGDTPQTTDELMAKLFAFTVEVEEHLRREERASDLANMPYRDYLQTCEWDDKRTEARARAGERCQVCNSPGPLHVHHRTYERRGSERDDDLTVLCATCHELFHRFGRLTR